MKRRTLVTTLLALLLTLAAGGVAMAHASLRQALPQPDSQVTQAPAQVALQFNEEVEAQFGAIAVYDQTGARVDKGDAALDPKDVTRVIANLKPLPDGLYTVTYRVVSADGHPISGSYGFTVGKGVAGASYFKPDMPQSDGTPPLPVLIGYWLMVSGLMAMAGLGLTQGLMMRAAPGPQFRAWVGAALGAAVLGTLVYLVARTAQAAGVGLADALNPKLLWRLLGTLTGRAVLYRIVLLVVSAGALHFLWRRWWAVALAGVLGLLTVSLGGHAVALERPLVGVLLDWLHLAAAALWIGGLIQLVFGGIAEPGSLGSLVRRFSPLAAISVAVLVGTGLYPTLLHVPSVKALTQTAYGLTLQIKVMLIIPLLLLGATNLLVIGPRLREGLPLTRILKVLAGLEVALMAVVLAAGVLLTNLPPARVALPPEELNVGLHTTNYAVLAIMKPLLPGYRNLDVTIETHDGSTITAETKVTLELIMLEHPMGPQVVEGKFLGDGKFRFENVLIGMPGKWQMKLNIAQPGKQPETIPIDIQVPEAP